MVLLLSDVTFGEDMSLCMSNLGRVDSSCAIFAIEYAFLRYVLQALSSKLLQLQLAHSFFLLQHLRFLMYSVNLSCK